MRCPSLLLDVRRDSVGLLLILLAADGLTVKMGLDNVPDVLHRQYELSDGVLIEDDHLTSFLVVVDTII